MQLFIFLSRYLAFISNVIFDGEQSLKLRSTPSRLRFAHHLPIPLPPPSPSPPTSPSSSGRNPEMSPSPLLRDVGSSSGIPNSLRNANPAASSPFQRDVDGSSSLDGGMREVDTRGGPRVWEARQVHPENEPQHSLWFVFFIFSFILLN